jgi:hypothetical protein
MPPRLTKPLREAIMAALDAALAGEGFDGGDFDGMDPDHFERARDWIAQKDARAEPDEDVIPRWSQNEALIAAALWGIGVEIPQIAQHIGRSVSGVQRFADRNRDLFPYRRYPGGNPEPKAQPKPEKSPIPKPDRAPARRYLVPFAGSCRRTRAEGQSGPQAGNQANT